MTRFIERDYSRTAQDALIQEGFAPALARALAARGVVSAAELKADWRSMLAPGSLPGANDAARLLANAIEDKKRIMIIADYDCDGATACAVAIRGLRAMGAQVDYLVPDRFVYGYGLTPAIVDLASTHKPDILLTVDNGMASIDGVARAKALGIETIITDHHLPADQLPQAACIVNPNAPGCVFASKNLAGVGVMFYVLMALRAEMRARGHFDVKPQPRLDELVDLVALGTVADVVKLDHNNRILVTQGLNRIRAGHINPGLRALLEIAGRPCVKARVQDFGFAIAPRINAAGRLDVMTTGIECLISDTDDRARELARELEDFNRQRRELEVDMQWDAAMILNRIDVTKRHTLSLFEPGWHQGIVGLVASRIKESKHRPTIAFAQADPGELKGSGRSIDGVHLRDMLDLVSKKDPRIIKKFGGHAMAAGLTIDATRLEDFTNLFEEVVRDNCDPEAFERHVWVDGALKGEEISFDLIEAINGQIWGQGFLPPLFANEFKVLHQSLLKGGHLKLVLELDGRRFSGIFFRRAAEIPFVARLADRPEINDWRGEKSVQLVVEQIETTA